MPFNPLKIFRFGFYTRCALIAIPLAIIPTYVLVRFWVATLPDKFYPGISNYLVPAVIALLCGIIMDLIQTRKSKESSHSKRRK